MRFTNPAPMPAELTGGTLDAITAPVGVANQPLSALSVDASVRSTWGPLDHGGFTSILDMTGFNSFGIAWNWSISSTSNLSAFGQITLQWFPTSGFTSMHIARDQYEIGCNGNIGPGIVGTSVTGMIRGPIKGDGLQILFNGTPAAPGGTGRISASGELIKSYRQLPVERWGAQESAVRILGHATVNGLPAGTVSAPVLFEPYDGLVEILGWHVGTTNANSHIRLGWGSFTWQREIGTAFPGQTSIFYPVFGAGAYLSRQVSSASRRPLYIRFFNGEATAKSMTAWIVTTTMA